MSRLRIGLLGMADNAATREFIAFLGEAGVALDVVFLSSPGWRADLRRALRKLKNAGLSATAGRALYALRRRLEGRRREAGASVAVPGHVRVHRVGSYNDERTREILRSENLDLALCATDEILKRATFRIPRIGALNAHPGWLPQYRGLGSEIRMLRDGLMPAVSVHFVDEGIDTGPVLLRRVLDRFDPAEIESGMRRAQARAFAEVIRNIEAGHVEPIDTFLEPSRIERGVPPRIVRQVTRRLSAAKISLAHPSDRWMP
jgi:folate-dependent phosphoribosylglycinamide formyltransferase PurN